MQYESAYGLITRTQLESAIHEFHRRDKLWASAVSIGQLHVPVAHSVLIELWRQRSKLMAADNSAQVFLKADFDTIGDRDQEPMAVDMYLSKVVGAAHEEVHKCIIHDLSSSLNNDSTFTLDLSSAPVVFPSTPSQQCSIQRRPDLAIRATS